jgi:uncharacterized protein with FMN-binding domain
MRRVLLAIGGTVTGLVMLLSFKSHSSSPVASQGTQGSQAVQGGSAATAPAAGSNGSGSPAAGSSGTGNSAAASSGSGSAAASGARTIDGNVANTMYGPVQIQLTVRNNKIAKVTILEQPQSSQHDIEIGQFAFPVLISETLKAQSAHIDSVSGATYTSGGYVQSLQSAIDNGA